MTYATPTAYNAASRATWHAEGLRWIAGLITATADRIDRNHNTPPLPLEPTSEHKPFDEFLYDARFRVQNDIFLR